MDERVENVERVAELKILDQIIFFGWSEPNFSKNFIVHLGIYTSVNSWGKTTEKTFVYKKLFRHLDFLISKLMLNEKKTEDFDVSFEYIKKNIH